MKLFQQLRLRPRLLSGLLAGVLAGMVVPYLWPTTLPVLTRSLLGWNVGVWLYLFLALRMMLRSDHLHLQRQAKAQADGISIVLLLAVTGALASLGAIGLELSHVRGSQSSEQGWPYLLLAISTVTGSWLLLPIEFALAYASLFHAGHGPHGLEFPGDDAQPDYMDFMYFAVTVAATSQTSDVAVSARPMRRLVLLHAVLSFIFNTGVLAVTINILAGLIS